MGKGLLRCMVVAALSGPLSVSGQSHEGVEELVLNATLECAEERALDELAGELGLRMPDTDIAVAGDGDEDKTARWELSWRMDETGDCWVYFSGNQSPSVMRLNQEASVDDIRMVATRVAWLASVEDASVDERQPEPEPEVAEPEVLEPEPLEPEPLEPEPRWPEAEPEIPEPDVPEPAIEQTGFTELEPAPLSPSLVPVDTTPTAFKFSFVPVIFYSEAVGPNIVPRLSFNILGGRSHGLDGMELGLLYNGQESFVRGLQISTIANHVGGDVKGTQIAGIANINGGSLRGVNVGGLYNGTSG
ncbi:MAG: hypothetical protein ACNA8W_09650, partial [Bradymonadaceae bacterium]